MHPLLNVLEYQLRKLSFATDETFRNDAPHTAQISTTFLIARHPEDVQRFGIEFSCRLFKENDGENIPYQTDFSIIGEFASAQRLAPEGVPARVANNALMILYGIARGVVAQLTATGVYGAFVIPAITFDELIQKAISTGETGVVPDEAAGTVDT
jgi:preprotein translocase subunit SecB